MNASVLVTEWGGSDGDLYNLRGVAQQQDAQFTSSTYWDWKQSLQAGCSWSLYKCASGAAAATDPNGLVDGVKLAVVSRVIPWAVVGQISAFSYNSSTQVFAMQATTFTDNTKTNLKAAAATVTAKTLIYVPAHVRWSASEVVVRGAAKLSQVASQPDGSRIIEVAVATATTRAVYTVQLGDRDGGALRALQVPVAATSVGAREWGWELSASALLRAAVAAGRARYIGQS
eukprot:COSAG01_NODE_372_length_17995_cov_16.957812_22_plen_230_part_00